MMVLQSADADALVLSAAARGRRFRACFREDDWPGAVRGVWRYLDAARQWPVELELLPAGSSHAPSIRVFPEMEPLEGECRESVLVLRTSGTTGRPKPVRIPIAERYEKTRGSRVAERWILTYAPFRWAGVSMLLHVLKSASELVVARSLAPTDLLEAMRSGDATHVSWTPSLFRHFQLMAGAAELGRLPLRQITFGGEYATQDVLDRARELWPDARISHVYAATEFGDLWSVSDGLAGCPEDRFQRAGFELTAEGELVIHGKPTGDLWQLREGRFVHQGRREDIINVGGAKVSAVAIEEVVLAMDGVRDARAYGLASPLLGQLVGLEICGDVDEQRLRDEVESRLGRAARPAEIVRTERIRLSAAHKKQRAVSRD
ncbi:AMP-binding protein [bacterium]|nr:AMP-binding protein [bacterium]